MAFVTHNRHGDAQLAYARYIAVPAGILVSNTWQPDSPTTTGRVPGVRPFDPFPYVGLSTIVSLEAIFLSLFILVSQNRASRRADERAHLDLQVNLLSEREATKMLQLLQALCAYHGLSAADDAEVTELLRETEPAIIARESRAAVAFRIKPPNPNKVSLKQSHSVRL